MLTTLSMTIPVLICTLTVMVFAQATSSTQQVPPHRFGGAVTIDGVQASDGVTVAAIIAGTIVAETITHEEFYIIDVPAGENTSIAFEFTSLGIMADQLATWEQGGVSHLDLSGNYC